MKNIVVSGFTHSISNPLVVATVALTGVPSINAKVDSKGICKDVFGVTVTNITVPSAGATIPDPGPYSLSFQSTVHKIKNDGVLVLQEGDKTADITATPNIPGSPTVPFPVTFHLEISSANQTFVKGE